MPTKICRRSGVRKVLVCNASEHTQTTLQGIYLDYARTSKALATVHVFSLCPMRYAFVSMCVTWIHALTKVYRFTHTRFRSYSSFFLNIYDKIRRGSRIRKKARSVCRRKRNFLLVHLIAKLKLFTCLDVSVESQAPYTSSTSRFLLPYLLLVRYSFFIYFNPLCVSIAIFHILKIRLLRVLVTETQP